jgi:PKD repeat protein
MNYRLIFCLLLIVAMVGVVSADTLIVYADFDGTAQRVNTQTFSNLMAGDGTAHTHGANGVNPYCQFTANAGGTNFASSYRAIFSYNTSSIGATSTVTNVSWTGKNSGGWHGLGDLKYIFTNGSLTDPTTINSADYQLKGTLALTGTYPYRNSAANLSHYFNTDGQTYINKSGSTVIFGRTYDDFNNTFTGTYVDYSNFGESWYSVLTSTTGNRPFLTIVYTTGGGGSAPVASFTCTKNFLRIPNSVTCTDSSTNTPTSWSWNMGDGSSAITTQNVTYPYMKRGIWGITLNATNAQGSNVTPSASNVRVVGYENNW